MTILVVNAGSSSLKLALFDTGLKQVFSSNVSEIGGASHLSVAGQTRALPVADHHAALAELLTATEAAGHPFGAISLAAHRVVHGGANLTATCRIAPTVRQAIEAAVPLAPLHNPANLSAIDALANRAPDLPQYAAFDTAFHASNPEVALRYALPDAEDRKGIRRYGFHGISYESLVERLPRLSGTPLPRRLLALHLGNGASLCAIRDGRSVATTMGYSPLDGLTMGTRTGGIDGNAVLRLAEEYGIDGAARLLNRQSGLLGLGGASDMRTLSQAGNAEARFAVAHFCYWAVRHAGSMIAAMGGIDGVAFTGGIGENDANVRGEIMRGLDWTGLIMDEEANGTGALQLHAAGSRVCAHIVPADEESQIAAETCRCLKISADGVMDEFAGTGTRAFAQGLGRSAQDHLLHVRLPLRDQCPSEIGQA
jgi:acetate kinase